MIIQKYKTKTTNWYQCQYNTASGSSKEIRDTVSSWLKATAFDCENQSFLQPAQRNRDHLWVPDIFSPWIPYLKYIGRQKVKQEIDPSQSLIPSLNLTRFSSCAQGSCCLDIYSSHRGPMQIPVLHISSMKICYILHFQQQVDVFSLKPLSPCNWKFPWAVEFKARHRQYQSSGWHIQLRNCCCHSRKPSSLVCYQYNHRRILIFPPSIQTFLNVMCPNIPFSFSLSSGGSSPY